MTSRLGPNLRIVLLMVLGCWALQAIIDALRAVHQNVADRVMTAIYDENASELAAAVSDGGGSWEMRDNLDRTLLMQAAASGKVGAVRLLLEHRVDLEATDRNRRTALFYAAAYDHPQVVRLLLDAGANPGHRDDQARSALQVARSCQSWDALQALLWAEASGAGPNRAQ